MVDFLNMKLENAINPNKFKIPIEFRCIINDFNYLLCSITSSNSGGQLNWSHQLRSID